MLDFYVKYNLNKSVGIQPLIHETEQLGTSPVHKCIPTQVTSQAW